MPLASTLLRPSREFITRLAGLFRIRLIPALRRGRCSLSRGLGSAGAFEKPGVDIQIAGVPLVRFSDVAGSPGLDPGIFSVFVSNGSVARILRRARHGGRTC